MGHLRIRRAAAASRFALAAIALVAFPIAYPRTHDYLWVLVAYVPVALVFQLMVARNAGEPWRAPLSGLVDVGVITLLVHLVGTVSTMLVALYVYQATVNTLVSGRRVGVACALFATAAYAAVVGCEMAGVLAYAPAGPAWAGSPTAWQHAAGAAVVLATLVAATFVVDSVTARLEENDASLREANGRLEELARRDPLTGLFNRRHVMERVEAELARVRRGRCASLVMVDLDRFKRVNDETGHERGDALLRTIARAVESAVRETDVVGRYGGDELVVLLPDTDEAAAVQVAERVVERVRAAGEAFDRARAVTASAGVTRATSADGPLELVRRADEAAYAAKAAGGDRLTLRAA